MNLNSLKSNEKKVLKNRGNWNVGDEGEGEEEVKKNPTFRANLALKKKKILFFESNFDIS